MCITEQHAFYRLEMDMIETTRLILIPLSQSQLISLLSQPSQLENEIGIPLCKGIAADPVERAIGMKLEKMKNAPDAHHIWITFWLLVIKAIPLGAGFLGFKGYPDKNGIVEIGYGIDSAHRSQGCMTEAVTGMINWAFNEPACQAIIAPGTLKTNPASNAVLKKVGMRIYEETTNAISWKLDRTSNERRLIS